jgi:hypothetical protein
MFSSGGYAVEGALPGLGVGALAGHPSDDVRAVLLSGFPTTASAREIHNLVYMMPGYEGSLVSHALASAVPTHRESTICHGCSALRAA